MDDVNPKKEELDFLHEEDLLPTLEKLGVKDAFLREEIRCAICGTVLTTNNLGSLYQEKDEVKMVCNKEECLERLTKQQ